MINNAGYVRRITARLIDLMLISLFTTAIGQTPEQAPQSFLYTFLLYNALAIILGGTTMGRFLTSISIRSYTRGFNRVILLLTREVVLIITLPLVLLTWIMLSETLYHDRVCRTEVIYHGKKA